MNNLGSLQDSWDQDADEGFRNPAMPLMCVPAAHAPPSLRGRASAPRLTRRPEAPAAQQRIALGRASRLQCVEAD
jgi:hypothetical protein